MTLHPETIDRVRIVKRFETLTDMEIEKAKNGIQETLCRLK